MKVSELKKVLELVKPGLAKKDLIDQSTCVVFEPEWVSTFNDEVSVMAPFNSDITGAVPAEPLYAFLNRLPTDSEITIQEAEGEFKLSCGKKRAKIRKDDEIKLPLDSEIGEPDEWSEMPEFFMEALRRVLFSSASSTHRPILTCVNISDEYMQTCDGYRMTRAVFPEPLRVEGQINVVAKNLERLSSYEPQKLGISGNWMQFLGESGVRYCVRIVNGEYPDLDGFLAVKGDSVEFPSEKDMESSINWTEVASDASIKYDQHVTVKFGKGKVSLFGQKKDEVEAWDEVRAKYKGGDISFNIHPQFLREIVKLVKTATVSKEALKIEAEDFIHIISLE